VIASAHLGAGLVSGMAASHASGGTTRRVGIALLLGLASHVMLDAIPHADYGELSRRWIEVCVIGESILVCVAAVLILRRRVVPGWRLFLAAGLFGAAVPDTRFGLGFLPSQAKYDVLYATYWFHSFFHADPVTPWIGVTTQMVAALACFGILFAFPVVGRTAGRGTEGYLP